MMKLANLAKLRRIISIIVFSLLTFYFLDFAGVLPSEFHVFGQIQLIPALMSGSIVIVACILVLTLLFGRVYCSSVCPLGFLQDALGRKSVYRRNRFLIRWSVVAFCVVFFLAGFSVVVGALDPYGAYGRIAVHLFKPVYLLLNNALAFVFNGFGNYAFYRVEIEALSAFSLGVAAITLAVVGAFALAGGRLYCNTVCPVGTILGFVSQFSLFKIRLDKSQCVSCGACEKKCKAACIDSKAKTIDYSRCVNCFDCIDSCNRKGISFAVGKSENKLPVDKDKRDFLLAGVAGAAVVLTHFKEKEDYSFFEGKNAISPPGAVSEERLLKHCTSCHLCVSKCPSKVLKPAFMEYGLGGMMMPLMCFEKGFCNFDCTLCADVCPNDALLPITKEEKHRLQVGKVVFEPELCVVHAEGWNCGACSEHCPTQAVKMIPYKNGLTIPFIDADLCVGCGGCEFICPVRPERAIYVKGNKVHQQAKAFSVEEKDEKEITDFGF